MMQQRPFGRKILIAPAFALLCFLALSVAAYRGLAVQDEAYRRVGPETIDKPLALAGLSHGVQAAHLGLYRLVTWRVAGAGTEPLRAMAAEFAERLAAVDARLQGVEARFTLDEKERRDLAAVRVQFAGYRDIVSQTEAAAAGPVADSVTLLWTAQLVYRRLQDSLDQLQDRQAARGRSARAEAERAGAELRSRLIWLAAVGAMAIAALALLLSHRLWRPFRDMTGRLACLAEGWPCGPLPVDRRDEIGVLARAAAAFQETLARLRTVQRDLIRMEKLATLSGMAAGAAAELDRPVAEARDAAARLAATAEAYRVSALRERPSQTQAERFGRAIKKGATEITAHLHRAATLTGSFKGIAVDPSADARERFDLGLMLEGLVTALRTTYRFDGPDFSLSAETGLVIDAHPGVLRLVLTHLVENAVVHAFPPDRRGRIALRLWIEDADHVALAVADDGVGIAEDALPRIWEPGYSSRPVASDSGLGLHLVRTLVTDGLRGRIRVASTVGKGTIFTLTLARVRVSLEGPRTPAAGAPPVQERA